MPLTSTAQPDAGLNLADSPTLAGGHEAGSALGWAGGLTGTVLIAVTAVLLGMLTAYLLLRRPAKKDLSKRFMYVPLLLVNGAAIYGQVAFFYEKVAPAMWPVAGKVALSVLIAGAIESVAIYVGWHAHDALLMKASRTAQQLRRASYLIAALVGLINYWHFTSGYQLLKPTAASAAFGLLSLLSPWLWGLHTRRAQHLQLTKEGAADEPGATFSAERMRAFPVRSYMARRWSIDHYVIDPKLAWQGYNAELSQKRVQHPGGRVRTAWLVLTGHAPGAVTRQRVRLVADIATGQPTDIPALTTADTMAVTATDTAVDSVPDTAPVTAADSPADTNTDTRPDVAAEPIRTPGTGHPADMRRVFTPDTMTLIERTPQPRPRRTSRQTPKWTKDQLKAFRLRDKTPDMTYPQIAREVGVSDKTISRWFQAREKAEKPDIHLDSEAAERVAPPMLTLPVAEPLVSVTGSANGTHYPPTENS